VETLPGAVLKSLTGIVGGQHVLTGEAAAGFAVDWTGRFRGHAAAVIRPGDTAEVAAVLALCTGAGVPVVPQGGNTGLVGGGVPLHGEVVLSLARLNQIGPVDREASQVTAGAGVTLQRVADADPGLDLGIAIASRDSATVGGAAATNAGGVRVLRYGPMRAQLRGIEAVLADGTVISHLAGLIKGNTGYDYPSLLAGSEGTLAVITQARLRLVPRLRDAVTAIIGLGSLDELHALAHQAVREIPGLVSAEFFTKTGLDILIQHAGLVPPLAAPAMAYLLLEASGPAALEDLAGVIADRDAAVGQSAADRRGSGPTGNANPRRPGSSASRSSSTFPCRPRTGCGSRPRQPTWSPGRIPEPGSSRSAMSPTAMCTSTSFPPGPRMAVTRTRCSPLPLSWAVRSPPSTVSAR
jgi:FAD/FMN-containing dehydrogenase